MRLRRYHLECGFGEVYPGLWDGRSRWNGWACPYFSTRTMRRIVADYTEYLADLEGLWPDDPPCETTLHYDQDRDVVVYRCVCGCTGTDDYKTEISPTVRDGMKVWDLFDAQLQCWSVDDACSCAPCRAILRRRPSRFVLGVEVAG